MTYSSNLNYPYSLPQQLITYYDLLAIDRNASLKEIEKAYKKQALIHHPDRNRSNSQSESTDKFQRLAEAYEVLKDPVKRKKYDQKLANTAGLDGVGSQAPRSFKSDDLTCEPSRKSSSRDPRTHEPARKPPKREGTPASSDQSPHRGPGGDDASQPSVDELFAKLFANIRPSDIWAEKPGRLHEPRANSSQPRHGGAFGADVGGQSKRRSTSDPFSDLFGYPGEAPRHVPSPLRQPAPTGPSRPASKPVSSSVTRPSSESIKSPSTESRSRGQVPTFYARSRQPIPAPKKSASVPKPLNQKASFMDFVDSWLTGEPATTTLRPHSRPPPNASSGAHACLSSRSPRQTLNPDETFELAWQQTLDEKYRRRAPRPTMGILDESRSRQGPRVASGETVQSLLAQKVRAMRPLSQGPSDRERRATAEVADHPRHRTIHRSATMRCAGPSERPVHDESRSHRARSASTSTGGRWQAPKAQRESDRDAYLPPWYLPSHEEVPVGPGSYECRPQRRQSMCQSPTSYSVLAPGTGKWSSSGSKPSSPPEDRLPPPARVGRRSRSATLEGGGGRAGGLAEGQSREFREVVFRFERSRDGQARMSREMKSRTVAIDGTVHDRYRRQRTAVVG